MFNIKNFYLKLFIISFLSLFLVGLSTVQGVEWSGGIENPLEADSFTELVENIITWIVNIGISVAIIMIIYAGLLFMTAAGEEEKITKARKALIWSLIGLAVLLIGKGFVSIIKDILKVTS